MILMDWQRGKIPYFVCPPFEDKTEKEENKVWRMRKECLC
jgi:ribosome biogenesis GTPase A